MNKFFALSLLLATTLAFPDRGNRIINGRNALPGEAPYMIQIQVRSGSFLGHFCGGALITPSRVVSAAHCFVNLPATWNLLAVAGNHNWRVASGNEQTREIDMARVVQHPNYNADAWFSGSDINFFEVDTPFILNQWVQVIALPPRDFRHTGDVQIFGWGSTHPFQGTFPDILQTTTKTIVDQEICSEIFIAIHGRNPIHFSDMCAGSFGAILTDSCEGDSGGPLVQVNPATGNLELVSVVAWGSFPCNAPNVPSVNTRTSPYIDFLTQ